LAESYTNISNLLLSPVGILLTVPLIEESVMVSGCRIVSMSWAVIWAIALLAIVLKGDPCLATKETVNAPWSVADCDRMEGVFIAPDKVKGCGQHERKNAKAFLLWHRYFLLSKRNWGKAIDTFFINTITLLHHTNIAPAASGFPFSFTRRGESGVRSSLYIVPAASLPFFIA